MAHPGVARGTGSYTYSAPAGQQEHHCSQEELSLCSTSASEPGVYGKGKGSLYRVGLMWVQD